MAKKTPSTDPAETLQEPSVKKKAGKKRTGKKKGASSAKNNSRKKKKRKKGTQKAARPFPQQNLEDALQIPQIIKDESDGKPMAPEPIARACNLSKNTPKFFYIAAASRDYGLTDGSRDTATIKLTELGRSVVFALTLEQREQKKIEAFFNIPIFKKFYDQYLGSGTPLPKAEFFSNALTEQLKLNKQYHSDFENIFRSNCKFLNIESGLDEALSKKLKTEDEKFTPSDEGIIVGQPKGKFSHTAFVIMPFTEKHREDGSQPRSKGFFNEVLEKLIQPAANGANFSVSTARREGSDIIHHTIIKQLLDADLVIADLSDHNPNVLFELGIRLANEKPVVLIQAEGTARIFDVGMLRAKDYNGSLWTSTVETDIPALKAHIEGTWNDKDSQPNYMEMLTVRKVPSPTVPLVE